MLASLASSKVLDLDLKIKSVYSYLTSANASGWLGAHPAARHAVPRLRERIRIVSLSDREDLYGLTFPVMRRYCEQHGYVCELHTQVEDFGRAPQWNKLKLMERALEATSPAAAEYVLWLDDDILLTALDVPIEWFVYASGFTTNNSALFLHEPNAKMSRIHSGAFILKGGSQHAAASVRLVRDAWAFAEAYPEIHFGPLWEQDALHLFAEHILQQQRNGLSVDYPFFQIPGGALQGNARLIECANAADAAAAAAMHCWNSKRAIFSAHVYGTPRPMRYATLHDIASLAGLGQKEALVRQQRDDGKWSSAPCVFGTTEDLLRHYVRDGGAIAVITGSGTVISEWFVREIGTPLLHILDTTAVVAPEVAHEEAAPGRVPLTRPDVLAASVRSLDENEEQGRELAIEQAAILQQLRKKPELVIGVIFGEPAESIRRSVVQNDYPLFFLDSASLWPPERIEAVLEAAFDRALHMGLIMGHGYDMSIAGGLIFKAVTAFCDKHDLRVVALSADASRTWAVRVDHKLFV
jgi:hypothetical protein